MNTYTHTSAINAATDFSEDKVIGNLRVNEALVGSRDVECCAFNQLVVGDTLCALGFRSGGRRKIQAIRIVDGKGYVLVKDGWYRWPKCYAHVV
jgi:hypothetical protein